MENFCRKSLNDQEFLGDENGKFIAAKCTPWKGNFLAKEAEVLGVRDALNWIKHMNYTHVEVEMDAANVL